MSAQAWFITPDVMVVPGEPAVATLTVVNLGETTETFSLIPVGLASGWTTIRPATVTLFGGSQEQVQVEVIPPALPSTTAGATALTVRVIPQSNPEDVTSVDATLEIAPNHDRRINLLQPALRSRRKAVYELMVENRGNTQASCRMRLADSTGRVEADFDPPAIGVEPGASTLVKMKLRARKLRWERRSRTVAFNVEAEQSGCPTASSPGTFVQAPVVPEQFWGRLMWLTILAGALAGAWFGVIRPEIRRAVRTEVADTAATVPSSTVAPSVSIDTAITTTTLQTTPTAPVTLAGVAERLQPQANINETISAKYVVPDGFVLLLTDYRLQNQGGDTGTAVLLGGGETLLTWNLDLVQADDTGAWRTAIEVVGGQEVAFQITCTGAGDGSGICKPALLFSGQLRPTTNP